MKVKMIMKQYVECSKHRHCEDSCPYREECRAFINKLRDMIEFKEAPGDGEKKWDHTV